MATVSALATAISSTITSPTPRITRIGRVQPRDPRPVVADVGDAADAAQRGRHVVDGPGRRLRVGVQPDGERRGERVALEAGGGGREVREVARELLAARRPSRQYCTDAASPLFVSISLTVVNLLRLRVVAQVDGELRGVAPAPDDALRCWR